MFDGMPEKLSHFNLFLDAGTAFFGRVEEVTPPVIAMKELAYRSGGMDAELSIDQGLEKMTCSVTMATYERGIYQRFGIRAGGPIDMMLRGALTRQSVSTPISMAMRGVITKLDAGTWKGGEDTNLKFECTISYYRVDFAEQTEIEIDIPNMVRIIGGEDQLATARAAILK